MSLPDPSLASFCQLEYVLKGIRQSGAAQPKRQRLPITPDILRAIYHKWSQDGWTYDRTMLWAAFCLAFFGFLRAAEFTCNPLIDSSLWLSLSDVGVNSYDNPSCISIFLKHSKTDPFGAGITLFLGATGNELCPVSAMLAFLAVRGSVPGPLFSFHDGVLLSRDRLVVAVRQAVEAVGICSSAFSGHSFRVGAATTAAKVGLNDSLIQTLGRWKSSAFLGYIRTPRDSLLSIPRIMVQP